MADVVLIVSVEVFEVPEPENVDGLKPAVTPVGAEPPVQVKPNVPEQFPFVFVSVIAKVPDPRCRT